MLTAIGDVMRKCYEKGWITTRDGNISLRKSLDGSISKYMYITPKGVRKYVIHPEDIIKLEINDTPSDDVSAEFHMHRNLLVDATKTISVVHVHPTHVVAAMARGWCLKTIAQQYPEITRYTKVGLNVPYEPVGSTELATKTNLNLRDNRFDNKIVYDIVGQEFHGVCAVGANPWDAYEHIERLDHICQIALLANK